YTDAQYQQLAAVTRTLIACYPAIADNMTGHCNIAPDRKTDPGYLHPELPQEIRGTYKALGHPVMVAYFKQLGITALELLPVAQF
ncbi:N-acetylmuramoyl-L-alanine amidase, partial [Salmonella enterica subsp. enterica serovar Kentucky]|nr:N-acetylmuramoyl-L-alanine amidase [Salmonella enterica subsp. enterica serovar Kentucky]